MSKLGKMERERAGGARWAIDLIKKVGLEAAEQEFEQRQIMTAPLNIEMSEIERYQEDIRASLKKQMCALTCLVLHDEYGFNKIRLERFIKRWNLKMDCLVEDISLWKDFKQVLIDECDVDIDLPIDWKEKEDEKELEGQISVDQWIAE